MKNRILGQHVFYLPYLTELNLLRNYKNLKFSWPYIAVFVNLI